ncbi:MAG: hypothetical protein L0228_01515 [Planctomycetes bacterium]|nr:hypothetical protein [Planctomycetota bacterium]
MRRVGLVVVLLIYWNGFVLARDVGTLIAGSNPAIQKQLKKTYNAFLAAPPNDVKSNCEAFQELQKLKEITDDKGALVKELAIFVVTTESVEEQHVLQAGALLHFLDLPPSTIIRVFAPYLDADNRQLRDFVRMWFQYHDSHDRTHGRPPLGSVNYYDYMEYVRNRIARNEEIPAGFINFIYERHPGKALLVFAYANRAGDVVAQLHDIRRSLEAARQGQEKTPEEIRQQRETKRQHEIRRQEAKIERREIQLAEHIVSNAIWLKENEFAERFQAALPEAMAELEKLARHKEWWARLYVVYIMRQYPQLRQANVLQQLSEDSNAFVSKAAKSVKE